MCMLLAHLQPDHGFKVGQVIQANKTRTRITGNSGKSTGPHCHVELRLCTYGPHFWDDDPVIHDKKTYTVDPMWFFHDFGKSASEIRLDTLDEPQNWELFKSSLDVIRKMAPWFDQYTIDVYNGEKE